ncbi:RAVE protein 1 C terminal-domain-containing protein [Phyllosticta citriasiana]|uniref:RAVE protein 1 C terminal-domain-containing protein n=1 Tax=Phyllosticta citriasiana TaxID=595635 RepID=UPI0030FD8F6B
MRAILPGRPNAELAAVTTGLWEGRQIIAYISGNALIVLGGGPRSILQTTYHQDDVHLRSVVFDETTGKMAVASKKAVYVYKPYGVDFGEPKWSLQHTLTLPDPDDDIRTLSWGISEEILVGSSSIALYSTHNHDAELLFTTALASPVKFAHFSYDATFIASTADHDRLVKLWHRLSFGSVEERFDVAYLPHPTTITGLHWRRPRHREQLIDNVLYTICADNKVRVWVGGELHHGPEIFQLWAEIDLVESIKPRAIQPSSRSSKRYAFFIDSADFALATERAVQQARDDADKEESQALQHLIDVANRTPEVCVVLDNRGNMSAWGLESVSCKARKTSDIFNIAHVEGLRLHFARETIPLEDNVQFRSFCGDAHGSSFTLLMHHFDGRLEWLEGKVDLLFDPSPIKATRIERKAILTGHRGAIKKVVRTATGRALISRTEDNEGVVWRQEHSKHSGNVLARHSTVDVNEHIHRTALLQEGSFVAFLHHDSISLWDARGPRAKQVARCEYKLKGKPLCLLLLPEVEADSGCVHLATVSSHMKGVAWEVRMPPKNTFANGRLSPAHQRKPSINVHGNISLEELCTFTLGSDEDLAYVLPVDPAGTPPVISGFLDTFARDVAISYTTSGVLNSWTARLNEEEQKIDWLLTSTVDTGIENPTLVSGTSIRKAALVDADRTGLTIWNTRSAQLEHEERFESHESIRDLDWSSSPDNQSILAVGFPHRVVIYTQLRYDYLNAGPSWTAIREVRIRDLTPHPIGDSVWLGSGNLVIGAGNQLFVQDEVVEVDDSLLPDLRSVARRKKDVDLFTLVSRLNGPLPVYHPQLLAQCVLSGKLLLVQRILINLFKSLKFYTEGDPFDTFLGLSPEDFCSDLDPTLNPASRKEVHSSYAELSDSDIEPASVTEEVATSLNDLLAAKSVPLLSSREQFHLADIVECVGTVEKHRRSIDDNGCRFLLFFRQKFLREGQRNGAVKRDGVVTVNGHHEETRQGEVISWREMTWAYHSGSQDILLDLVGRHFQGRLGWKEARKAGVFMWMTDLNALRSQFEVIARNEYTKTEERNPVDCALYYLALRKKPVLVGLWRMATWSREQSATHRLLQNDFSEPRWRTAALKNAYALMGKRRFHYAASFFLLADHLGDAVMILANQCNDLQLAIAVARVYEGDEGPILTKFLKERVLPRAVVDGNRWVATWAFWMLGEKDKAVRALVSPLSTLLSPPDSPTLASKLFLSDDPALVVLYRQLRQKSLQTLRGALAVSPRAEWQFVVHTARLYERMGCDLLALDLVRGWEFLLPTATPAVPAPLKKTPAEDVVTDLRSPTTAGSGGPTSPYDYAFDPKKLLRRRSSLVVQDLPVRSALDGFADGSTDAQVNGGGVNGAPGVNGHGRENGHENGDAETDGGEKKREEDDEAEGKKKKPPPTQFVEPDANSLLDSFGF